jgi:carbon storage regulator CsrA
MLVLSRRLPEKIHFPGIDVVIQVVAIQGGRVSLGIDAPPGVTVLREEVQDPACRGQRAGAPPGSRTGEVTAHGVCPF